MAIWNSCTPSKGQFPLFSTKKTYNRSTDLQIPHDFRHSRNRPNHHVDRQSRRLVRLDENRHRRAGIPAVKSRGKRSRRVAADEMLFVQPLFDLVRIELVRNTFASRFSRASCARWRPFRLQTRISRCSFSLYFWNARNGAYAALQMLAFVGSQRAGSDAGTPNLNAGFVAPRGDRGELGGVFHRSGLCFDLCFMGGMGFGGMERGGGFVD